MSRTRTVARIAVLSALIYVLSYATATLPNVSAAFFLAFAGGWMWGIVPGMLAGAVGMWLWSSFNPYGPVIPQIMLSQIVGLALCGLIGGSLRSYLRTGISFRSIVFLILASIVCTLAYFVPVNLVDAWIARPFWPRFYTGMLWSSTALISNLLIFPLLFPLIYRISQRERQSYS